MGYVVGAYDVKMNEPDPSLKIAVSSNTKLLTNSDAVAGVYSKMHIVGKYGFPDLVPFVPHLRNRANMIAGVIHRFGCSMSKYEGPKIDLYVKFTKLFFPAAYPNPLVGADLKTTEEWLRDTSYSMSRKKALLSLHFTIHSYDAKQIAEVKAFIKDEGWDSPKIARIINSYSDESKTLLGALINAVDKATFSQKWFVKGQNPSTWPAKMEELFGSEPVLGTDFTSFESHHHDQLLHVTYFWMMHMTRGIAGIRGLRKLIARLMCGVQDIKFNGLFVQIIQRLMSGALWTSSANAVLNLTIMMFMSCLAVMPNAGPEEIAHYALNHFKGLVEGDDGICVDVNISPKIAEEMSIKLKFDKAVDYANCGFCGIVCDRTAGVVIKDPRPVLRKIFLLPAKYRFAKTTVHLGLLRARAMSYLVNFGACPVIAPLCHYILRNTKSIDERKFRDALGSYHVDTYDQARVMKVWQIVQPINQSSRTIVAEKFNLPVWRQLQIESTFDKCNDLVVKLDLSDLVDSLSFEHSLNYLTRDINTWVEPEERLPNPVRMILKLGLTPTIKNSDAHEVNVRYQKRYESFGT